ncbi:hypothetical protein Bca101_053137 [Brassica carinata]
MNSFSSLEYDKVSGKEDKPVPFLEHFSSEFTDSLFKFEDEILSSGKYHTSAASFLAFPDLEPISINPHEDLLKESGSVSWTAKESMLDEDKREDCDLVEQTETQTTKKMRGREDFASNCSVAKPLSKETIKLYYHMPLTQVAKELNIGLTLLKKKCRDLGIQRWPHQVELNWVEVTNLTSYIFQLLAFYLANEMLEKGEGDADDLRNVLEKLKKVEKMMEELPDLEFEDKIKRLRQAFYKARQKRKRSLVMPTSTP